MSYPRIVLLTLATVALFGCARDGRATEDAAAGAQLPFYPLSTKSPEAREHIEAGVRLLDGGRWVEANERFKRAAAADSAYGLAYALLARFGTSFDEWRLNSQRAVVYSQSATPEERLLIQMQERELAQDVEGEVAAARQLVERDSTHPRGWFVLSGELENAGRMDEARAAARKVIELAPTVGLSHLNYGIRFTRNPGQDLAVAEQHILEGVRLWPNAPVSHDYVGDLRRAQGRLADAVEAYSRMIELDPRQVEGYNQRGHAYTFLGKHDLANRDYEAGLRIAPPAQRGPFARFRAWLPAYAGDYNRAITQLFEAARAIDGMGLTEPAGEKWDMYEGAMYVALHRRDFAAADSALAAIRAAAQQFAHRAERDELRRSLESDIAIRTAMVAAVKGEFAAAERAIAEYTRLVAAQRNPTKHWPVHAVRGLIALEQKRYADAVRELEQSDPNSPWVRYHRAVALEGGGRAAEAQELYRAVANYNFNNAQCAAVRHAAAQKVGGAAVASR